MAGMTLDTSGSMTYRRLFAVSGFPQLATGALLSRMASSLFQVALVLYVLETFHAPALAGLAVFVSIVPGLLFSPIAGALLDRHGRVRMILADYLIALAAMVLLAALAALRLLNPASLLLILACGSITGPLSGSGNRALFPLIVPRTYWDRANAVDSGSQALATVIGPALAGVLVAVIGGPGAFLVTGALYAGAAASLYGFADPRAAHGPAQPLLRSAWQALVYVLRHRTLRGIILTLFCTNFGNGAVIVGLPLLVLTRFHWGDAAVGNLWAACGIASVAAGLFFGRMRTEGRERTLIAISLAVGALAIALMAFASSAAVLVAAIVLYGTSAAPSDLGLFALRQRRTDPAWFGRMLAVSMSLNYAGSPIGSALAGPLLARSLTLTLLLGALLALAGAAMPFLAIPREAVTA
jgi:MFS family permease